MTGGAVNPNVIRSASNEYLFFRLIVLIRALINQPDVSKGLIP